MQIKMKRFLSMLLAVLMITSTPMTVFAENGSGLADGSISVEDSMFINAVVKNTATEKAYEDLQAALDEAADGETIALLKDIEATVVAVPVNVSLDLNGHTLTTSYMTSFGDIVDGSENNGGLLKVTAKQFMLQKDNAQIPVKNAEGYKFFEVTKFNTRYQETISRYDFQPFVEAGAHELLKAGAESSGVTINVRITWTDEQGKRIQDFEYSDDLALRFLNSYNNNTDKYGQMFTLTLKNAEKYKDLTFCAVAVSDAGVEIGSEVVELNKDDASTDVPTEGSGELSEDVTLDIEQASAVVLEGTKIDGETLALTTEEMAETTTDVTLSDGEEMLSLNVHVDGVAKDNTVPVIVTINEIAPEYLNQGNITLYHVENGETVEMTRVYSLEEVDAHNEFYYDVLTGTITMALATFSEIAIINDTSNPWNGEFDYDWYDAGKDYFEIANADQLAAFGAIVGGMDGQTKTDFAKKTVKLLADIDLGDAEENNVGSKIFYPIGYYNNTGSYTRTNDSVTSSVSSFAGTFDGNGHIISNFYQNTWEMFGDYNDGYTGTPNYYKDAMGLFGYVLGGTVKNLTVDNFSSDGEFTPTGVIAAYAVNSTFENIAITNCNPRVYNTGNGGIVGIGGNPDDPEAYKLNFNNITIDNTNKITALWGSWDVACGGLIGMFRGAGHVYMTNCHVAAQMDVYNDVCGNYQYYWYRYSGMMVGTNKNMVTDKDGYTVPETDKFHAEGCTVHFGEWNDYYYCELVANSLASYTHDHQFSRLEQISSLDDIKSGDTWKKAGNFLLISGDTKTCYHIVKNTDGTLKQHLHTDEGYEDGIDENGDGENDLKEDKQIVYLPFNQLFTGYGWGVKHIPIYDDGTPNPFAGVTILDREVADSVKKFDKVVADGISYTTGTTVTIEELFKAADQTEVEIDVDNVNVTVSPVDEDSTANGTYTPNKTDWTKGTLTFRGVGVATITIQDYNFCIPTTINVTVTEPNSVDKFALVGKGTEDDPYVLDLHEDSSVTLEELFTTTGNADINSATVEVTVNGVNNVSYSKDTTDWTKGKLDFAEIGSGTIIISDNDYCNDTVLYIEVVESVQKFTSYYNETLVVDIANKSEYSLGELFSGNDIDSATVNVSFEGVSGSYKANTTDWTKGSINFTEEGTVQVTIKDGIYCLPTTIDVEVHKTQERFKLVFTNTEDYLYRVGNANTVALGSLFTEYVEGIDINNVNVSIKSLDEETNVEGAYTKNDDWTKGTIEFSGTGPIQITIDADYTNELILNLEVVDATNVTSYSGLGNRSSVLLNDITMSSGGSYYLSGATLYGNGFTFDMTDGTYAAGGNTSSSYVFGLNNANIDNVKIVGAVYTQYGAQVKDAYNRAAVLSSGNSTIINSYVSNCASAVRVKDGNLEIVNSTIKGGNFANVDIRGGHVVLDNVTTINQVNGNDTAEDGTVVVGLGVVVYYENVLNSTTIEIINGITQYNHLSKSQATNYITDTYAKQLVNEMFGSAYEKLQCQDGNDIWVNTGIISMISEVDNDNITDVTGYEDATPTFLNKSGYVHTKVPDANSIAEEIPEYITEGQGAIAPSYSFDYITKNYVAKTDGSNDYCYEEDGTVYISMDEGDTFNWDTSILTATKNGQSLEYTVSMNGVDYTGKSITFSEQGAYEVIYAYTDSNNYDIDEERNITTYNKVYSKSVHISVAVVAPDAKNAEFTFGSNNATTEKITIDNVTYVSATGVTEDNSTWTYITINGQKIYYPIVSAKLKKTTGLSAGAYAYFPVFENVVTITDYADNGTGDAITYNSSTTTLPSTLTAVKGVFKAASDVPYWYNLTNSNLDQSGASKIFKWASSSDAPSDPELFDNKVLCYKSPKVSADRKEYITLVQYSYTDATNTTYYYYVGYMLEKYSHSCVTPDTLVTLSDGTQKRIDEVTYEDQFLVWDFVKGEYTSAPASIVKNHGYDKYEVVSLRFEDGTVVKTINGHGFYHKDTNEFIILSKANAEDYLGHEFIKEDMTAVKLVDYNVETQYTESWSVLTAEHYNCILEGMLTITPAEVEGSPKYLMPFKVNDDMKYDDSARMADIEKYGLYTFEEFEHMITYEQFKVLNLPIFKVAVGKGYITYDEILYLLELHMEPSV